MLNRKKTEVTKRLWLTVLTILTVLTCPLSVASKNQSYQQYLTDTGQLIRHNHQQFEQSAKDLAASVAAVCKTPEKEKLEAAREQWQQTMRHWMHVSVLQFGPLQKDDRRLRIQAWPVRHKLVKRQVRTLLKQSGVSLETIRNSSVVLQGLPALEYILYQESSLAIVQSKEGCATTLAIASHLQELATNLSADWMRGYGDEFVQSGGKEETLEYLDEFLNGLVTALQQVKRRKLSDPLGLSEEGLPRKKGKLKDLESWQSRTSLNNVRTNLSAIESYLTAGKKYGVDDLLEEVDPEGGTIIVLQEQLLSINQVLAELTSPLENYFSDSSMKKPVQSLYVHVSQFQNTIEKQLFADLGITRDFNSEDGD